MSEILERLARIETTTDNLKEDIEEIKKKVNTINGVRSDVESVQARQQFYVMKDEFMGIKTTLRNIDSKLDNHIQEHKHVWMKLGVLATIVSAIVSVIVSFAAWVKGHI